VHDAISAGATETGVTIHVVDEGVDTGPKIAQRSLSILPGESEGELHERIKVVERELLVETVLAIAEKKIDLNQVAKNS
jgi:phosphoribosylglycinamide formyltransferase-1